MNLNSVESACAADPKAVEAPHKEVPNLAADESGVVAVEFGLIATPFLALLFGILAVGLYFFTQVALENAVVDASRQILTGQAQTSGVTAAQFAQLVCNEAPAYVSCGSDLRVNVQSFPSFNNVVVPSCTDGAGNLQAAGTQAFAPGAASTPTLVTVCYQMPLIGLIPFMTVMGLNNGDALIQVSTVFQTEPFAGN